MRRSRKPPGFAVDRNGFTLIEVLLALTLLALLMAGAFASIHASTRAVDSGEKLIDRTNKLRVAQEFLRRELSQAQALVIEQDPTTGETVLFEGDGETLRFVAPMPGYLGRGGPYVQQLSFEQQDGDLRLLFRHAMHNGYDADEEPLEDPELVPVVLLEHIAQARFEYRALDDTGKLDDWKDEWDKRGRMPLLVRISIEFEKEANQVWPEMVVPLMIDSATSPLRDPFMAPFTGG
ncbi:MAG TPA: prepilin-type N-terminal cleavage/methylation domain-containing protein [Candidatus Saccharimonadia bacterium]|nr:prepilin-type N-terminal cleavage/methylation domain-containing protein [Candidatus Saccharimonadia bacterium]